MKAKHILYLTVMLLSIVAMGVVLNVFPRSTYSELERRELTTFPTFSWDSLASGDYTKSVSSWYSDTEPFRDVFMETSMRLREMRALRIGKDEEQITYHAATDTDPELMSDGEALAEMSLTEEEEDVTSPDTVAVSRTLDDNAKIANHGIIIVGKAPNARALMAYHGKGGGESYAQVVNTYKQTFGEDVQVYCMVVPSAVQFYCPEKAKSASLSEEPTLDNLYAHLLPSVKQVKLLPVLAAHADEDIYLRTDHHWSPLGAYYAAREFARVAGVPFRDLSTYEQHVVHGFVGTMYGFSQDIAIKHSPEDFVYYIPTDVTYTTTYTVYDIDENYRVVGEHRPHKGAFFCHFKDGSGAAYCTFMGGDSKITKVETSTQNGRRLLILKDSYGNALPGYLFGSFEEVHVVDGRYFTKNMVEYVSQNGITDIVFTNNVFKAYAGGKQYLRFLKQSGGVSYTPRPKPVPLDTLPAQTVKENVAEEAVPEEELPAAEPVNQVVDTTLL